MNNSLCSQMMTELKILVAAERVCPNVVHFFDAFWQVNFIRKQVFFFETSQGEIEVSA